MLPCVAGQPVFDSRLRIYDAPPADAVDQPSFRCEVAAWTVLRLGLPELAELRLRPESRFPARITPQFLKNSDDQTIATLAAIFDSMDSMPDAPPDFREWGVVAASRNVGRGAFAATLHKYGKDGPWGVSVQVVPHHLLHSVSSTISLALPCQGPCLGAGGGLHGEVDALLAASSLMADRSRPGVWVTWSYWDPELTIDATGKPTSDVHCVVGALALSAMTETSSGTRLEIRAPHSLPYEAGQRPSHKTAGEVTSSSFDSSSGQPNLTSSLLDISRLQSKNFAVVCQLSGGLEMEISGRSARSEVTEPVIPFNRQPFAVPKVA